MKNWLIVLMGVIILTGIVISAGEILGGGTTDRTATPIEISVNPAIKDSLTSVGINKVVWYQEKVLDENTICWAIISEPYIHKYNLCLPTDTNMSLYVKLMLDGIALDINRSATNRRGLTDNRLFEATIKNDVQVIK